MDSTPPHHPSPGRAEPRALIRGLLCGGTCDPGVIKETIRATDRLARPPGSCRGGESGDHERDRNLSSLPKSLHLGPPTCLNFPRPLLPTIQHIFLRTYYVPGTDLGAGDTQMNKTVKRRWFHGVYFVRMEISDILGGYKEPTSPGAQRKVVSESSECSKEGTSLRPARGAPSRPQRPGSSSPPLPPFPNATSGRSTPPPGPWSLRASPHPSTRAAV